MFGCSQHYLTNFADSRMELPRYRSCSTFLSVFSSSEVSAKITQSIRSKLPTEKFVEIVKPTCVTSKATSVPQTPQTNHYQYSSPVEALNFIVESKSQPVELDNSTIELHVPSRRKKSLQLYCSVDFDFLACDLRCHVA